MGIKDWLFKTTSSSPWIEELFAEFGKNQYEDRTIDATLSKGINLAYSGEWERAVTVFRDVAQENPDYDVPHFWLADYVLQKEGPSESVHVLCSAAKQCRRKSELLMEAAELSLFECGDVRGAVHLFAQSIAAMEAKPASEEISRQRAFLFMKEIFLTFQLMRESVASKWVDSMQVITHLGVSSVERIRLTILAISPNERNVILSELQGIRDYLCQKSLA